MDSSQKAVLGRAANHLDVTQSSSNPTILHSMTHMIEPRMIEPSEAEGPHLSLNQQPPANARIPLPSDEISILTWLLRKPPLFTV